MTDEEAKKAELDGENDFKSCKNMGDITRKRADLEKAVEVATLKSRKAPPFTWGSRQLGTEGEKENPEMSIEEYRQKLSNVGKPCCLAQKRLDSFVRAFSVKFEL